MDTNKDFLSSNVAPRPVEPNEQRPQQQMPPRPPEPPRYTATPPQPPKPPFSPPPPPPAPPSISPSGRMQYEPQKGGWRGILFVILGLILVGVLAAGYYYFDEIKTFFYGAEEEPLPAVTPPVTVTPPPPATTTPPVTTEPVLSADEIKMQNITDIQDLLSSYFQQNGVYPEMIQNDDEDGFYCYRQNGAHYILGTVLEPDNFNLENDLDGDYHCGNAVKSCVDPVYCVAP